MINEERANELARMVYDWLDVAFEELGEDDNCPSGEEIYNGVTATNPAAAALGAIEDRVLWAFCHAESERWNRVSPTEPVLH